MSQTTTFIISPFLGVSFLRKAELDGVTSQSILGLQWRWELGLLPSEACLGLDKLLSRASFIWLANEHWLLSLSTTRIYPYGCVGVLAVWKLTSPRAGDPERVRKMSQCLLWPRLRSHIPSSLQYSINNTGWPYSEWELTAWILGGKEHYGRSEAWFITRSYPPTSAFKGGLGFTLVSVKSVLVGYNKDCWV